MAVVFALVGQRLRGRQKRSMFALVAVSALATLALVAGLEVRSGIGSRVQGLYIETGRPDLVIIGGPNAIPPAVQRAKDEGLVSEAFIYQAAFGSLERPDGTGVGIGFVAAADFDEVGVGSAILRTGRWPEAADELVLDAGAAVAHDYQIGTLVRIERNGEVVPLNVVGTAVDLSDCFYPSCSPLRGYVTHAGLDRISPEGPYARVHARLSDGVEEEEAAERIRGYERVSSVNTWSRNRQNIVLAGQIFSAFLAGFGGFVLLATLLVVASTAVGMVVSRRREFGLLKALGATSRQLTVVTLLEQVVLGMVGVAAGWMVGSIAAPWMQVGLIDVVGRSGPRFDLTSLVIAGLSMVVVLIAATVVPARRAGSLPARVALADAAPPQSRIGYNVVQRLPLPPPSLLGVQLILARPARALLSALAIAVALAAGLAGWRLSSAVNAIVEEPGLAGDPYDVIVAAPPTLLPAFVSSTLSDVAGVGSWYTEDATTTSFTTGSCPEDGQGAGSESQATDPQPISFRGIGAEVGDAGLVLAEGRLPQRSGEALAGWGIVEDGQVGIGDTIRVELDEQCVALVIVGRHGDLDQEGRAVVVSMADYRELVSDSREHWRVSGDGSLSSSELTRRIEVAMEGQALIQPATEVADQLGPFQFVLALLVALVAIVAAANLAATLVASTRERRREVGVVRALGFSEAELRMQAASSGVVVGLLGVGIGLPVGAVASAAVLNSAVKQIGLGPGLVSPALLLPAVVAGCLGVAVSAAVSVAATRGIRSTPATELVRES